MQDGLPALALPCVCRLPWLICMSIVFAHVQVSNYALTMHLRTAQDSATSSITGRFHPDVF